jgi:hypothetical protein
MPQTRDIGRLFFHGFRYPMKGAPRLERGVETVEVEPPYRVGRGFSVRWGPRRALVFGRWGLETREEAEALYDALRARDMAPARPLEPGEDILAWMGAEEDLWEEEFGGRL